MSTITVGSEKVEATICQTCPGGFKIFPPSAMAEHVDRVHSSERKLGVEAVCIACGQIFEVTAPSRRCAKCRRNSRK